MENTYKSFYRNFYLNTNGFIPSNPLNKNVYPGDFFQIFNGEMVILGNIFHSRVLNPEDVVLEYRVKLNPANWDFSVGVSKPYSERSSGQDLIDKESEFSKQVLAFDKKGSFFFRGKNPEAVKISNWNDILQALIIKLTTINYSFRSLYVVTESASTSDWTLAISGSDKGALAIAIENKDIGLGDIFGHQDAKTLEAKDIEYYNRESIRKPSFFKAKKLVVQDEKHNVFISDSIKNLGNRNEWAKSFYDYDFYSGDTHLSNFSHASMLDMLSSNQLNPNTALLYFRWVDANLDDIEKLLLSYG